MPHATESPRPTPAVSCALLREGRLLMVRRRNPPHAGRLALPGGRVEAGEPLAAAAERELLEETGVQGRSLGPFTAIDVIDRDEAGRLHFHYVLVVMEMACRAASLSPQTMRPTPAGWTWRPCGRPGRRCAARRCRWPAGCWARGISVERWWVKDLRGEPRVGILGQLPRPTNTQGALDPWHTKTPSLLASRARRSAPTRCCATPMACSP